MGRDQGTSRLDNPWPRIGWWFAAAVVGVSFVLGFVILGRYQQNGPTLDTWDAICRAIGITAENGPEDEPQPPLRTPTRVAWTRATLAQVASGNEEDGAFVALNCGACHGEQDVSSSDLVPTLARMDSNVIYKQLDDYRSGKRLWGVMGAIATARRGHDRSWHISALPLLRLKAADGPKAEVVAPGGELQAFRSRSTPHPEGAEPLAIQLTASSSRGLTRCRSVTMIPDLDI